MLAGFNMEEYDWNLWGQAVGLIGGAWMAEADELQAAIDGLSKLVGTGYYDDGDEILLPVIAYLKKRLERYK